MYIMPAFRGEGVAQALMRAALEWAEAQPGLIGITLQVATSNVRGRRFYERFGFTTFGTEERSLLAAGAFHGVHYMELVIRAATGA